MCTAALRALRANRPDLRIVAVAKSWVADIIRHSPDIDSLLIYQHRRGILRLSDTIRITRTLKRENAAAAILFQTAFESALMAYLAGIPIRIGRKTDHRGPLINHPVVLDEEVLSRHQVHHYMAVTKSAVGSFSSPYDPVVTLSQHDRDHAGQLMKSISQAGPVITLAPGAAYGSAKRWPPERFSQFATLARESWNARLILCGGPGDMSLADDIQSGTNQPILSVAGKVPLLTQAALIEESDVCISNDSGLMHLAAALGTPVVALFGPTKPGITGPWGDDHQILHNPVPCAPCRHRECPTEHLCMRSISANHVLMTAAKIIEEKNETA
jgi:lipopolysaccharide heptosyltransferase II